MIVVVDQQLMVSAAHGFEAGGARTPAPKPRLGIQARVQPVEPGVERLLCPAYVFHVSQVNQELPDKQEVVTLEPGVPEIARLEPFAEVSQVAETSGIANRLRGDQVELPAEGQGRARQVQQ